MPRHEDLSEASQIASIGLAKAAARSAYYAAFHAAEAFIFEKTGRIAKSHSGVRSEFARLTKDDPHFAKTMTTFLAQAYKYRELGDYGIGPDAVVTISEADAVIISAEEFLSGVEAIPA